MRINRCTVDCNTGEEENVKHFLIDCGALNEVRNQHGFSGKTVPEICLFEEAERSEECKRFIGAMWRRRRELFGGPDLRVE